VLPAKQTADEAKLKSATPPDATALVSKKNLEDFCFPFSPRAFVYCQQKVGTPLPRQLLGQLFVVSSSRRIASNSPVQARP